jgi:hypothetical protein
MSVQSLQIYTKHMSTERCTFLTSIKNSVFLFLMIPPLVLIYFIMYHIIFNRCILSEDALINWSQKEVPENPIPDIRYARNVWILIFLNSDSFKLNLNIITVIGRQFIFLDCELDKWQMVVNNYFVSITTSYWHEIFPMFGIVISLKLFVIK